MDLTQVRAIVTGGGRGLGACFARELVRAGASVAIGDVNDASLASVEANEANEANEAIDAIDAAGHGRGRLIARTLDVADERSVCQFVTWAMNELRGVNVLVNNAGILRDGLVAKPEDGWIKKLPSPQWRQVLDVNLTGTFLMTRETLGHIFQRGITPAVIVNLSSATRGGRAGQSNYSASKAGIDALTRTWALELASMGIRVASIAPGVTDTPMLDEVQPAAMRDLLDAVPLRRIGTPEEIWLALKFVLECDYFTGRTLEVDGGGSF